MAENVSCVTVSNWSKNQSFKFRKIFYPTSTDEIVSIVKSAKKVKVIGTAHSFNTSAAADDGYEEETDLICLSNLCVNPILDEEKKTITVSAGSKFGEIFHWISINAPNFALHNSASLPHISVGGAIATATHGSGVKHGNLSSAVVSLELIKANGEIMNISRETKGSEFDGYIVHLGCLGVVTRVTLSLVSAFNIRQDCFVCLDFDIALQNIDEILSSGYSVSLFTTWSNRLFEQVWRKSTPDTVFETETFFGSKKAITKIHPCDQSPECCTEQLGQVGPSYERLPHFKFEFQPSVGDELQSEFFIARADAAAALEAIMSLSKVISPLLFITEVRSIASDKLWMSTAYDRESVAIHFTWKPLWNEVQKVLPMIEIALEKFSARPHWGKLFSHKAETISLIYPKINDFAALREQLDPEAKFVNKFLIEAGVVKHR
jgi:alditol oxidase